MTALLTRLRPAFHDPTTRAHHLVEAVVWTLILVSVGLTLLELVDVGTTPAQRHLLTWVDRAVLVVFAVEISLRIATYQPPELALFTRSPRARLRAHVVGRLRYMARPLVLVDLLTVVALHPALRGLRALRILRLLRVFRYANPFEQIWGAFQDNALLYVFACLVLAAETVVGGVTMYFIESGAEDPAVRSIWDGMWWTLVTLTTVGYGDIAPVTGLGRLWAGLLMVEGMFTIALFAGVVGHTMLHTVLTIREEQFRMSRFTDHIVVIGFEPGSRMLLDALLEEERDASTPVVIFGPGERPPDVPPEFRWVQGDPAKESELGKVHLTHAKALVIVGSRVLPPQQADAATVLGVFTARAYLAKHADAWPRTRPLPVVVEILESENVAHARAAGADEVIESTRLGFALLAHTLHQPGTAAIMSRVVSAGAQSTYVTPGAPHAGRTFGAVAADLRRTHGVLLLGLRTPRGQDQLNPSDEITVSADHHLVYLAPSAVLPAP